jgi:hypothetical protein
MMSEESNLRHIEGRCGGWHMPPEVAQMRRNLPDSGSGVWIM